MEVELTEKEFMYPGHVGCPGCGAAIAMRFVLKSLGEKMMMVLPACCWSVIAGPYPTSTLKIPVIHSAFETGGATASGVRAALDMKGDKETTVVTWAGDGGTFDIGFQALSGAVERNEDFIYVCYDNEAYMNTGIQRSSSTPYGAWTTTTPGKDWKKMRKKNIVEALAAHRIPYAATASISHPEDLVRKVQKSSRHQGLPVSAHLRQLPHGLEDPLGDGRQDRPHGRPDKHLPPLRSGGRPALHDQPQTQALPRPGVFQDPGPLPAPHGSGPGGDPEDGRRGLGAALRKAGEHA